jgi:hypothetical protein
MERNVVLLPGNRHRGGPHDSLMTNADAAPTPKPIRNSLTVQDDGR